MTGMRDHAFGCTCQRHVARPWNRPEHWSAEEVATLESWYGRISDEKLAAKLGRSVTAIILKKKRLGISKKDQGLTGYDVAELFGVDETVVTKVWLRRGLLRARRGWLQGPHRVHLISEIEVERFIQRHGQYIDVDKMPESPYRTLAEQHRFYSLPDVQRLTGRHPHAMARALALGRYRGVKRGSHWYVPADELPKLHGRAHLGPATSAEIAEIVRHREAKLELRRNRRKGVAA